MRKESLTEIDNVTSKKDRKSLHKRFLKRNLAEVGMNQ